MFNYGQVRDKFRKLSDLELDLIPHFGSSSRPIKDSDVPYYIHIFLEKDLVAVLYNDINGFREYRGIAYARLMERETIFPSEAKIARIKDVLEKFTNCPVYDEDIFKNSISEKQI